MLCYHRSLKRKGIHTHEQRHQWIDTKKMRAECFAFRISLEFHRRAKLRRSYTINNACDAKCFMVRQWRRRFRRMCSIRNRRDFYFSFSSFRGNLSLFFCVFVVVKLFGSCVNSCERLSSTAFCRLLSLFSWFRFCFLCHSFVLLLFVASRDKNNQMQNDKDEDDTN